MTDYIRTWVLLAFIATVPCRTPLLPSWSYSSIIQAVPFQRPEQWFVEPDPVFLIDAPFGHNTTPRNSDDNAIPAIWGCLATVTILCILSIYTHLHKAVVATYVFHQFLLSSPFEFCVAFFFVAYIAKSLLGQTGSLLGIVFVMAFVTALLAFIGVTS